MPPRFRHPTRLTARRHPAPLPEMPVCPLTSWSADLRAFTFEARPRRARRVPSQPHRPSVITIAPEHDEDAHLWNQSPGEHGAGSGPTALTALGASADLPSRPHTWNDTWAQPPAADFDCALRRAERTGTRKACSWRWGCNVSCPASRCTTARRTLTARVPRGMRVERRGLRFRKVLWWAQLIPGLTWSRCRCRGVEVQGRWQVTSVIARADGTSPRLSGIPLPDADLPAKALAAWRARRLPAGEGEPRVGLSGLHRQILQAAELGHVLEEPESAPAVGAPTATCILTGHDGLVEAQW